MAEKKVSSTRTPLVVGVMLVLAAACLLGVYLRHKTLLEVVFTPQPSPTVQSQTHPGYEEPKAPNGLTVVDVIVGGEIEQKTIIVKPNTVIAFKNEDTVVREVVSDSTGSDGFATGILKPGEQLYVAQYKTPGTYTYHLKSDPSKKGTIVVKN